MAMSQLQTGENIPSGRLAVHYQPIEALTPYPGNPRTHSKRQIDQIAKSIKVFGFTNPVLITRDGIIIAGHGRVLSAKALGMTEVPTIYVMH